MKTTLTVDENGILTFPDELLEATGWEEGDVLNWITNDDGSFIGSHDIMTSIKGSFSDTGALVIDVKNSPPNFDDPEAMKIAQDST